MRKVFLLANLCLAFGLIAPRILFAESGLVFDQDKGMLTGQLNVSSNIVAAGSVMASSATLTNTSGAGLSVNSSAYLAVYGGNVGIGTISPGTKLDVNGAVSVAGLNNVSVYAGNNQFISFANYAGTYAPTFGISTDNNTYVLSHTGQDILIKPGNSVIGITAKATTGNVGIGTAGPGYKLDVAGAARMNYNGTNNLGAMLFSSDGASHSRGIFYDDSGVARITLNGDTALTNPSNFAGALTVGPYASVSAGTSLAISGNVGIGTTSPGVKLDVINSAINGDTQIGRFDAPGSTAGNGYVSFGSGFVGWDYTNGGLGINAHSAGGPVGGIFIKRIDNGYSNVGIGTTNPGARLQVAGDIVGSAQVFRAYMTASFSHPGAWVKIPFNATLFNTLQGTFNTTLNRFTASRAGYYRISVTGYSSTGGTGSERYAIGVQKNGGLEGFTGGNYSASDTPLAGLSPMIVYLNGSTDYVEIWAFSAIAATWSGGSSGGHVMFWYMDYLGT